MSQSSNNVRASIGNASTASNNVAAAPTVIAGGGPPPPTPATWTSIGDMGALPDVGWLTNAPLDPTGTYNGYTYDAVNDIHYFDYDNVAVTTQIDPNTATAYAGTCVDLTGGTGLYYPDGTAVSRSDQFLVSIQFYFDPAVGFAQPTLFLVCDIDPVAGQDMTTEVQWGAGLTGGNLTAYANTGFNPISGMGGANQYLITIPYLTGYQQAPAIYEGDAFVNSSSIQQTGLQALPAGGTPKLWLLFTGDLQGNPIGAGSFTLERIKYTVTKL